jgi:hypothetical protein
MMRRSHNMLPTKTNANANTFAECSFVLICAHLCSFVLICAVAMAWWHGVSMTRRRDVTGRKIKDFLPLVSDVMVKREVQKIDKMRALMLCSIVSVSFH